MTPPPPSSITQPFTQSGENESPPTSRSGYLLPTLRRERNPSEAEISSRSSSSLRSRFSVKGDKFPWQKPEKFICERLSKNLNSLSSAKVSGACDLRSKAARPFSRRPLSARLPASGGAFGLAQSH